MNNTVGEEKWQASVSYEFAPREVKREDQYINPLGFNVTNYTTKQKLQ
jgi:type IV secretory pathway component VirB8